MNKIQISLFAAILAFFPALLSAQPLPSTKIVHDSIPYFVPDNRITLEAIISDDTGVATARCYFHASTGSPFLFVPMILTGGNKYRCTLPALTEDANQLEYLFLVVNRDRQVIRSKVNVANVLVGDEIPAWQTSLRTITPMTVYSELKGIEAMAVSMAYEFMKVETVERSDQRHGFIVDIYSPEQIPDELNAAPGYFGGFVQDSPVTQPRAVEGFGIGLKLPD